MNLSGRQIAENNVATFASWMASKTDDDFRAMANSGVLCRTEIATECGFSPSVLNQNPRVKKLRQDLEKELRERGVLPPAVEMTVEDAAKPLVREPGKLRGAIDAERLRC